MHHKLTKKQLEQRKKRRARCKQVRQRVKLFLKGVTRETDYSTATR